MIIGVFYFELYLPGAVTRKDKRSILNSLKQRLKNSHNLAVSEVDLQDKIARAALGMSTVSLKETDVNNTFDSIKKQIYDDFAVQIVRAEKEIC